ncbi:hypothetical protein F4779DRAFT_627830 [Xylariaceae sp. FL0662B]|nr:hypothetical protein F4779DRAFT_627830 [Xylariaceae sp. FL0662B]
MRQELIDCLRTRNPHCYSDSVDFQGSGTVSSDFAGLVDAILDGSAVFDDVSDESLSWVGDIDSTNSRMTETTPSIPFLQDRSGDVTAADPYPWLLEKPAASPDSVGRTGEDHPIGPSGKPRCWDHGCNGREFSSKSNFMRHIKERSGASTKCVCPLCGAIFTRNSARDTHLAKQSCNRIRRYSNGRPRPSRLAMLGNPSLAAAAAAAAAAATSQDTHWRTIDWGSMASSSPVGTISPD